jgi:hypothetical protein
MTEKLLLKVGYFSIYENKGRKDTKYRVDSGKTINLKHLNKVIPNKNRINKEFKNKDTAIKFARKLLAESLLKKKRKLEKLPKSLYLVLIKEEKSNKTFVKVGITSKKYIIRRFSKVHGYDGYKVESVLRRIDSKNAEKMESNIKDKLNRKRSVQKYRPLLESFSGYSECYNYDNINDIIKIFDAEVLKNA